MNLQHILPQQILFSLSELQSIGLLKITTAKKFIRQGNITAVKIGNKLFIARDEIIRYFNDNVVVAKA